MFNIFIVHFEIGKKLNFVTKVAGFADDFVYFSCACYVT